MLTAEGVAILRDEYPGARFVLVLSSGSVIRNVILMGTGTENGKPALYAEVNDETQIGPTAGKRKAYVFLEEIIDWAIDSRKPSEHFRITIFDRDEKRVVRASWESRHGETYGNYIYEALEKLRAEKYTNPPDCSCTYDHCSAATCPSIAPSRTGDTGGYKESERMFPADPALACR